MRRVHTDLEDIRTMIRESVAEHYDLKTIAYKLNMEFPGVFTVKDGHIYRESADCRRSHSERVTL